ncbi:hypothetical protein MASR1M32_10050 [Rhodobacter sp.]
MYWCQRALITAQQAPSVAPLAATIDRHSARLLAFQTEFHHQGKAVQTPQTTMPMPIRVSSVFIQPENRFSRSHFTAPVSRIGGSFGASISVLT